MDSKIRIGVIGASSCSAKLAQAAYTVGKLIAESGAILICGGMGGVMEAACHGAIEAGGMTVGILPGSSARDGNEFLTVPVVTGLGYARNSIVVQSSQVLIAIGGKYGTLSELAYAAGFGIPVVGLSTWKIRAPIKHVRTPEEAVRMALKLVVKQ
ncbi:MAG: TIGR00725 family protein [Candidatus Edwardsbacteria bacterium]|nr:TIGR00725 family protein [Candidatus Edwardsbacteria bacterium]MBU1576411.1 TIGR00725 family protein [Candidatus Edwardsbacteria bacterium]MBU2463021.1 TIGR00725 family protein [Candidatus Edwardsbacteria bacterium]MBU2593817.1 TIGR00725 family protein [Candidatus Edwardsbacteria bacterium]